MWLKSFMTVEGAWQCDSGANVHEREVNIFCYIAAVTNFVLSQLWRNEVLLLFLHLRLKMISLSMSTLMSPYGKCRYWELRIYWQRQNKNVSWIEGQRVNTDHISLPIKITCTLIETSEVSIGKN